MPDFLAWSPDSWSALATWVGLVLAVIAGGIAFAQYLESKRTRREQTQPYVMALMRPVDGDPGIIDVVLQNYGLTAAYDIRPLAQPTLQRSSAEGGSPTDVWLPDVIPMLAPGQEWKTWWDIHTTRASQGLAARHELTITFTDSHGEEFETRNLLDWAQYEGLKWITRYTTHHVGKALRELASDVSSFKDGAGGGVRVFVRDGDERDRAMREELERRRNQRNTEGSGSA